MTYLHRALEDKLATIQTVGKREKITYHPAGHTETFDDPEEKVRAECWAELIYRFGYPAHRIGVEVTVPDRTPHDAADLVVFEDDQRTKPYAVIECKPEGISDAQFHQAVEQAFGNGNFAKLRAKYAGVVAGVTRQFHDFAGFAVLERQKNIIGELTGELEEAKGQAAAFNTGDVLFSRLRPYLNKVYVAESSGVCSTEFHIMRPRPSFRDRLLPEYLAAVLRSSLVLRQVVHMMTGNTHPRLANDDVVDLITPLPPLAVQREIAAEVVRRRERARTLRAEAAEVWDDAKAAFEAALLGQKGGADD